MCVARRNVMVLVGSWALARRYLHCGICPTDIDSIDSSDDFEFALSVAPLQDTSMICDDDRLTSHPYRISIEDRKLTTIWRLRTWTRNQHMVGLSVSLPHVAARTGFLLPGSAAGAKGRRRRKVGGIHRVRTPAMNRAVPRMNEVNAIGKPAKRSGVKANQGHIALVVLRKNTNPKENDLVGRGRGVTAQVGVEVEAKAAKVESIKNRVTLKRLMSKNWKKPCLLHWKLLI